MIRLRQASAVLLLIGTVYFAPLALLSHSSSLSVGSSSVQWEQQQAETVLDNRLRRLQQNDFSGGTIPPKFTQLDRAAETQRIYRSVAEERSATARALANPTVAWRDWLVKYNVTYSSRSEADFRRQVWLSNLQRSARLNEMVGPEVAFGMNRFSGLTPDEFLQQYTGDAQKDSGIRVTPEDPQMLDTPIAPLLANLSAGTFLTPKGEKQNTTTSPDGGSGTNGPQPPITPTPIAPQPGGGSGGAGGGGGVIPPGDLNPPIVRPGGGGGTEGPTLPPGGTPPNGGMNPPIIRPGGGTTPGVTPAPGTPGVTPGVTPPPGGGLVTPPIITPTPAPGGVTPAPPGGTQPTPPGASPAPPGTVPPQINPPGVVAPGGATPPPPPGTSPAPAGGAPAGSTPPIVRPPGSIPTVGLPPPATPPPGASPSPSPPPSPPAPSPAPGALPGAAPGPSPAPGAPPSPAPGAPPGGVAPIVRPPIGPPPPAGRRRRQLLEMQLQQWVEEQQLQQQQQLDGAGWAQDGAGVVGETGRGLRSTGDTWLQLEQQQRSQSHSQQQQQQRGHGYYLVLKAMAGAVKQAYHAWGVLLSDLSGADSRIDASTVGDSSDAVVGSTPPWLSDTDAVEGEEAVLPALQHGPHGWAAAADAAAFLSASSSSTSSSSSSDSDGDWGSMGGGRQLQQVFESNSTAICSKQVPWLFGRDRPMASVDWLRAGVVQPGAGEQSNCSNSFAHVAASLAESTMALLGYSGSAKRLSEAQLMACLPGASCSRAGTTHVLLNQLACNGFAAAASGPNAFPISQSWKAAEMPQACTAGDFNPVETGITGWSFVPPSELAFAQALSRSPIKVSVDATMLQSYRAGFIGCNVQSSVANHAILAVGYSQRVRATEAPGPARGSGSQRSFTFFTGGAYWMLRNSWGTGGSVDGYVYVAKGCGAGNVAPLGLLANRGVLPVFNASQTYGVGRLQCYFPGETPDPGCDANLLLRLSSFCAKVEEFLPLKAKTNCSCSCIPV